MAGALVGTTLGIRLENPAILKTLGLVPVVASFKLIGFF